MVLPPDHGDPHTDTLDALLLAGLAGLHDEGLAAITITLLVWFIPVRRWLLDNELCDFDMAVFEGLTRLEALGRVTCADGLYRLVAGVRA